MAKKEIKAILWRSYMAETSKALWRETTSQYYIDLPKSDYENFFGAHAVVDTDREGNTTYTITLEPFDGVPAVGSYALTFKKLRPGSRRQDTWNINGQWLDRAYKLWQPNNGPLKKFSEMSTAERSSNFLIIARDVDGRFHGRWIRSPDFAVLPEGIKEIITSRKAGWTSL